MGGYLKYDGKRTWDTRKEGPRPLKRPLWLADIMDNLSLDCRDAALRLTGLSRSRVGA